MIAHGALLNHPHHVSMAADVVGRTGLVGKFYSLDEVRQQGFSRVCDDAGTGGSPGVSG